MSSLQKWNINNRHKHGKTTKPKRRKQTLTEKRPKQRKTKSTIDTTWGDDTNPMYTSNRDIPKNLRKLIKDRGEVISVLGDGHCLFRAVGKILHMEPGANEKYYVSETEIATRVTRYTEFENVKHNERGPDIHESEWGGTEDCQIIARWCKTDAVILHTKTDRGTVVPYTYNEIGERTIHHMEECGWIGDTQRGQNCIYLIYDGIHYNALKLNKENNIAESKPSIDTVNTGSENKDKQTKDGAQPNTNKEEATDIHTTNIIRKTDTNTHTKTKGKQEERQATNTHCVRIRGSPNEKHNQNTKETATGQKEAKGKNVRKRETMCETTHRKSKKKNKRDPDKCNKKQEM